MIDAAPGKPGRAAAFLRAAGLWVVLACALLRCLVAPEPFPYWDIDPGRVVLPVTGLTPSMSIAIDSITIFAGGAALLGEVLAGFPVLLVPVMLWILGCCGAAIHGLAIRSGSIEDLRIGATWCAAMTTGIVAMHVCRDPKMKRMTLAAAIGVVALLVAKGAIQVFVEHAETVARYKQNKEAFLYDQGWKPGSVAALNFERRLFQPEATGWFGLSNVFSTFAASTLTALAGSTVLAWREARVHRKMPDGWSGVLTLGTLTAGAGVAFAGGKGGYAIAAFGVAMLAAFALFRRGRFLKAASPRWFGPLALAIIAAVLGAVVIRGLIGERIGERSLLFRWYYMQGAVRSFTESASAMLWGAGPDGFRDAYMRLKPVLSPEEVTSPHSVLFDWGATLGVFGLAWAGLWLTWVWRLGAVIGAAASSHDDTTSTKVSNTPKPEGWYACLAASAALLAATWLERALGGPEQAAARLAGFAGWIGITIAFLQLLRLSRMAVPCVCIGALAAAAHCQIEVTPIWSASTCWIALLLAASGAPTNPIGTARRDDAGLLAPGFALLLAMLFTWVGLTRVSKWEGALAEAAANMRPLGEIRTRWADIRRSEVADHESERQLFRDLARLTGSQEPQSARDVDDLLAKLTITACRGAAALLEQAVQFAPRHFATTESLCRVLMEEAAAQTALSQSAQSKDLSSRALKAAESLAGRRTSANIFGLIGNLHAARFEADRDNSDLASAVAAWNRAAELDPHGMTFPLRVYDQLMAVGKVQEARPYALKLLELNKLQRLDPLKMLSAENLKSIAKVAGTN